MYSVTCGINILPSQHPPIYIPKYTTIVTCLISIVSYLFKPLSAAVHVQIKVKRSPKQKAHLLHISRVLQVNISNSSHQNIVLKLIKSKIKVW